MDTELNIEKINWDNSYIGDIDLYVSHSIEDNKCIAVTLKYNENTSENAVLYEFENFIPLICEEFKVLLNLRKTGKHIVKYRNKHMLMVKYETQTNLKDYLKLNSINVRSLPDYLKNDVQKYIAFRYLFCLKTINESSLSIVFKSLGNPYIINSSENELNYKSIVCQRIIDDWFGDTENFHQIAKSLIEDKDVTILKFQIQKIIEKYDKNLIGWTNVIYNRLLTESNII
jgi:hypothetical protein